MKEQIIKDILKDDIDNWSKDIVKSVIYNISSTNKEINYKATQDSLSYDIQKW